MARVEVPVVAAADERGIAHGGAETGHVRGREFAVGVVEKEHLAAGERGVVVLDTTPFYAESGGQLGDHGRLRGEDGCVIDVYDVQSPVPGLFVHRGEIIDGEVTGDESDGGDNLPIVR